MTIQIIENRVTSSVQDGEYEKKYRVTTRLLMTTTIVTMSKIINSVTSRQIRRSVAAIQRPFPARRASIRRPRS